MKTIHVQKYISNAVCLNDKTFLCLLCSKTFSQITNLLVCFKKAHNDFVKLLIKKFKCSICAIKFARKSACKRHFSLVHLNSKNYVCVICTETFDINFKEKDIFGQHLKHFKLVWKKAQHFECSICIKKFRHRLHLQKHIKKAHRDAKIFECILCAEFLKEKNALWKHIIQAHKDTKVFTCSFCFNNFAG